MTPVLLGKIELILSRTKLTHFALLLVVIASFLSPRSHALCPHGKEANVIARVQTCAKQPGLAVTINHQQGDKPTPKRASGKSDESDQYSIAVGEIILRKEGEEWINSNGKVFINVPAGLSCEQFEAGQLLEGNLIPPCNDIVAEGNRENEAPTFVFQRFIETIPKK